MTPCGEPRFAIPRALVLALRERGVLGEAGRAAGLGPDALEGGRRLRFDELVAFAAAAVRAAGDETLGVAVGAAVRSESFGPVGMLMMTASTLGDALRGMSRYKRLLADQEMALEVRGDAVAVELRFLASGPAGVHYLAEAECAFIVEFSRWATRRPLAPSAIQLRHSRTPGSDALSRLAGVRVECGRGCDAVVLPAEVLDYELVSADPAVAAALAPLAEDRLAQFGGAATITARLRALFLRERGGFLFTIDDVARSFAMSVRSLQRRLRAEQTSFQDVLDATRREAAIDALGGGRLGPEDVAFVLGFSHLGSFHRAFRRWTGMTPTAYREASAARRAIARDAGEPADRG